jgi:cytochrome P450
MTHPDRSPVVDFDHHGPEFNADADAAWKELREKCPVAWSEHHGGFWVVSDYEGNHEVLKHTDVYTSERWPVDDGFGTPFIPKSVPGDRILPIEVDPPDHIAVRQLLNPLLSPNAVEAMRPRVIHWVEHHIDQIIEKGSCDIVYDLTSPIPAQITLEWLGYPLEHAVETSYAFHDVLGYPIGTERWNKGFEGLLRSGELLQEAVTARRQNPGDDVISYLLSRELYGKPVDDETIIAMGQVLVGGGVDTTTSLTSSALVHLNRDRDLRRRLLDEPALLASATEEFLRMYPPLSTIARTVRQDSELHGCPVYAGDRVLVSRHSANYDANQFDDPEEFIPDRFPNRHVTFGLGPHRCVGSHLARVMFQEMLTRILARMPDYEIDETQIAPYPDRGFAQGWVQLPATFTPGRRTEGASS